MSKKSNVSLVEDRQGYRVETENKPAVYLKDEKGNITLEHFSWIDRFLAAKQVEEGYEVLFQFKNGNFAKWVIDAGGLRQKYQSLEYKQITEIEDKFEVSLDNSCIGLNLAAKGNAYLQKKQYELAITAYQKAIELKSDIPVWVYVNLGDACQEQQKSSEVVAAYSKAIEIQPENFSLYRKLGRILTYQLKFEQAEKLYKKAINLDPVLPEFYYSLADVLIHSYKFERANDLLQKNYNLLSENIVRFNQTCQRIKNVEKYFLEEQQKCNDFTQFESVNIKGLINHAQLPVWDVGEDKIASQEDINKSSESYKVLIYNNQESSGVFSQAKCFDEFCPAESSYIQKQLNYSIPKRRKQTIGILFNCLFDGVMYIDGNGYILKDITPSHHPKLYFKSIAFPKDRADYNETVFVLPAIGGKINYYHSLIDQLSCIIFYQKLNLSCKIFISQRTQLHDSILNYLNLGDRILNPENNYLKFSHLIAGKYQFDIETVLFYRETIRSSIIKSYNFYEKNTGMIYISRKQSSARKMFNEDQVEKIMEKLGFSVVYCEQLSFEEQVCLMSKASIVVSPHGAGLTNIIFCEPGTTIVEILPDLYPNTLYHRMSVMCNHSYYPVLGHVTDKSSCQWRVDLDKLERIISRILLA